MNPVLAREVARAELESLRELLREIGIVLRQEHEFWERFELNQPKLRDVSAVKAEVNRYFLPLVVTGAAESLESCVWRIVSDEIERAGNVVEVWIYQELWERFGNVVDDVLDEIRAISKPEVSPTDLWLRKEIREAAIYVLRGYISMIVSSLGYPRYARCLSDKYRKYLKDREQQVNQRLAILSRTILGPAICVEEGEEGEEGEE